MRIGHYIACMGAALGLPLVEVIVPALLISSPLTPFHSPAFAQSLEEEDSVQIYQQAAPATVSIQTQDTIGSGIIISPDGLILTAASIVQNVPTITVTLADGRKFQAETVGFAEAGLDLAVIQIPNQTSLPTIPLTDPDSVAVGQRAFVLGNPFGQFQGTLTRGIISRIDREQGLIQTDAAINPGDIGGPLLNRKGELVGIATSSFNPQAIGNSRIGLAVSVGEVAPFLIAVREGRVSRTAPNPFTRNAQSISSNGIPISGELTASSNILPADNSYFNSYTFEGQAGEQVAIKMTSQDFDPFLILVAPNARDVIQNDSGGGTNVEITATLPEDGTYVILANTYEPTATGRYSLSLEIENR